jgi:RNA polymerase sigma-70 factor (ECF subfamily)
VDEGFRELYEREFVAVFRAAFMLCGDRALAEDSTQEAFARALVRWRRLRDQPWAAGWVTTTALNVARRALRRRPVAETRPLAFATDLDEVLDLSSAIRGLPPRQQEAVALHYLLDLPIREVAESMGCEAGTVKAHLARARAAIEPKLAVSDRPEETAGGDADAR